MSLSSTISTFPSLVFLTTFSIVKVLLSAVCTHLESTVPFLFIVYILTELSELLTLYLSQSALDANFNLPPAFDMI